MKRRTFVKRKHGMAIFFAIAFLHAISANLAHPITPTLIVNLSLPTYMFGAAFAAMSFTNFLFSPFWGKMREFSSARTWLLVGSVGYGIGQYLFGISTTEITILAARCLAGFFVGAINVSCLIYLTEMSDAEGMGTNLVKFTISQSLGGAVGFLIGGWIGIYSIYYTFLVQAILIILAGVLFYFLLEDNPVVGLQKLDIKSFFREINPIQSFMGAKSFMNYNFAFLFGIVGFLFIGSVAFDQSFNYFLKDQLQFTSIYNGVFKAIIGIITLITNSTICLWIIKYRNIKTSTALILATCGVIISSLFAISSVPIFLAVCLVYFSFHSTLVPLLQDNIATEANANTRNLVMGFYNAIRALGMILGALFSGFLYDISPLTPFVLAAACFFISTLLMTRVIHHQSHS